MARLKRKDGNFLHEKNGGGEEGSGGSLSLDHEIKEFHPPPCLCTTSTFVRAPYTCRSGRPGLRETSLPPLKWSPKATTVKQNSQVTVMFLGHRT